MNTLDDKVEILITGSLQGATANIYPLGIATPIWTGITDSTGKVVKSTIDPSVPKLTYGDYTLEINKCDYDPLIHLLNIPTDTVVSLTVGCSSAITTHEATTTAIHGVGVSTIESIAGSQYKVNTHAAVNVSTTVHPNANTHILAVAPHTGHETPTGAQTKVTTHETLYNHALIGLGGIPSGIGPLPYLGTTPPTGWLLCNGSAISRTTYAKLFAVIGITSGAGDGSTTFNLPNMSGRIPTGIGASGVTTLGSVGGEQTHTNTIAEMPSHTHTVCRGNNGPTYCAASGYGGSHPAPTSATGGNQPHNNMQPYLGVNYIISI